MKETHLAIVSMPYQTWGPVYDDGKALRQGTIFQELDLPFYVMDGIPAGQNAQNGNQNRGNPVGSGKTADPTGESQLLCQIQQVSFVLDDLTLYLDTHRDDHQALTMYREKLAVKDQLKREFAQKFYPLTRACMVFCQDENGIHGDHGFCWQDGPAPWEGV